MPPKSDRRKQLSTIRNNATAQIAYDDEDETYFSSIFAQACSDFDATASLLSMKYSQWQFDSMSYFALVDDNNMEEIGGYCASPPSSSTSARMRAFIDEDSDTIGMESSLPFFEDKDHSNDLSINTSYRINYNSPSSVL